MKNYTDLEQSKVLSQILPLESADMYYRLCDITKVWHPYLLIGYDDLQAREDLFNLKQYKPCWSLAALFGVLPYELGVNSFLALQKEKNEYCCCYGDINGDSFRHTFGDNPIDACYEMIIRLNELNLL